MDSDIAIRVEGLGKKYVIGHQTAERGGTLRDALVRGVGNFARMGKAMLRGAPMVTGDEVEDFWALRDVNLEIRRGDVVGVIGRNGAGKSTLLKVLSRITEPTTGRVEINGRVASLLEVGTGFHPELSGRENIFLNGAILGMTRSEIRRKFDEIVAFSEVERFLDTPVKRYSSGMYVRLAFAVAAHLEPEILIIDEVLAVGDAEFQKKCLGKMHEVGRAGRTVLFVSHNMDAVDRLTSSCVLMESGAKVLEGKTPLVVSEYLKRPNNSGLDFRSFRESSIPETVSITSAWTEANDGTRRGAFRQAESFRISLRIASTVDVKCDFAIVVENEREQALFTTHLSDVGHEINEAGEYHLSINVEGAPLRRGSYSVSLAAFSPDKRIFYDLLLHIPLFEIAGTLETAFPDDERWGNLYFSIPWKVSLLNEFDEKHR